MRLHQFNQFIQNNRTTTEQKKMDQNKPTETTRVIEIELGKGDNDLPSAPHLPIDSPPHLPIASPPQLITEQPLPHEMMNQPPKHPEPISSVRPPPIHPDIERVMTEQPDYMQPPPFDIDSDVSTAKLWKRRDGNPLDTSEKIMVRLNLLNDITDYLKINEPKKAFGDKTVVRRSRRVQTQSMTQQLDGQPMSKMSTTQKKRVEKKPRKDCVCGLEKVEGDKRTKILNFVRGLVQLEDDEKMEDIFQFAQNVIPGLTFEEEHMEEDNEQMDNQPIAQEGLMETITM